MRTPDDLAALPQTGVSVHGIDVSELAGMALEARWADWHRTPLSDTSHSHVSVWRKH